jgi:CPA2 family monovalent cation:H+ antiporter-2
MHGAEEFIRNLAMVLCVAAVTTVVCQRLRQPVVLGYIVAGLIIGPHVPIPLVADHGIIEALAELGVILLMFSLGLEFSLRKLMRVGPAAMLIGLVQVSIMLWLGIVTGNLFGWTPLESLFTGALISISSTTIIAKAFDEQRVSGPTREIVFGVLIVEDLVAVLLLAILTAITSGAGASPAVVAQTAGQLLAFLVVMLGVGLLLVPRLMRAVVRLQRSETTLVASVGICFAVALLASEFGYSVALGAFLAGSLVAESGDVRPVERVIEPVRDMFAALFFVSVGMLIDPAPVREHWLAILALTAVVVIGKLVSVALGAFLTGRGTRTSIEAGMSMAQIGEFSFIIAGLGRSGGVVGDFLYPVSVVVSAATTLLTPWLIRASGPVASLIDRNLPAPLQTFVALYGSWIERLRVAPLGTPRRALRRRIVPLLVTDVALLAGVILGTSLGLELAASTLSERLGLSAGTGRTLVIAGAIAVAAPLCIGVFRLARDLGRALAEAALPTGRGVDTGAVPRTVLMRTVQAMTLLAVVAPLVAVTAPFLPPLPVAVALTILAVALGAALWRSTAPLHGHVRAGAQLILEILAKQSRGELRAVHGPELAVVRDAMPGLGEPVRIQLDPASPAAGRTLAELNLRARTGAAVLAITRGEAAIALPSGSEMLQAGDILALAGSHDAIGAARSLLGTHATPLDS